MRKKLSKLKWNFVSIFVITLLGVSLFHFFGGPKEKEYKLAEEIKILIICDINSNIIYFYEDFCNNYKKYLKTNITTYLNEAYNLNGKINVRFQENFSYYTIEKDYDKNIVNNYDELKKIINSKSKIYLKQLNLSVSSHFTSKIAEETKILNSFYVATKILSPLLLVKQKKIEQAILDNLQQLEKFQNSYINLKSNDLYSLNINENIKKKLIDHKFARLNYLNVFLISLIFAIFLNVLFLLSMEVKRLYKW